MKKCDISIFRPIEDNLGNWGDQFTPVSDKDTTFASKIIIITKHFKDVYPLRVAQVYTTFCCFLIVLNFKLILFETKTFSLNNFKQKFIASMYWLLNNIKNITNHIKKINIY